MRSYRREDVLSQSYKELLSSYQREKQVFKSK